jgi:hypothetical protein
MWRDILLRVAKLSQYWTVGINSVCLGLFVWRMGGSMWGNLLVCLLLVDIAIAISLLLISEKEVSFIL